MTQLIAVPLGIVILTLAFLALRFFQQAQRLRKEHSRLTKDYERAVTEGRELRTRYSGISDLEAELTRLRYGLEQAKRDQQELDSENERRRVALKEEYERALGVYKELKNEVSLLEENIEDISFGLYKPHFSFQTPDEYKTALEDLRNQQRQLIRDGRAAVCPVHWTVGESQTEGARMVKLVEKLLLRAFNGECDAALANVSWNNVTKMVERIRKSFEAVNKLGEVLKVSVTQEYLKLRLDELRLTQEYETKRYQERQEQRQNREKIREEERAQQEFEKAREEAEADEARFRRALERAREEAAKATGAQLQKLTEQVSSFEAKLEEARQKKERAISRAQLTKSGFVYVISNVGSFGERVYKIGMTRRIEPTERIDELGGASVPFPFDIHVMFYSSDAPELEGALHRLFEERRVNLVNLRREFYRDLELGEIEAFAKTRGLMGEVVKQVEAREYRETLARREQRVAKDVSAQPEKFSDKLFGEERFEVRAG